MENVKDINWFWPHRVWASYAWFGWLIVAAVASMAITGTIIGGVLNAVLWYCILFFCRFVWLKATAASRRNV